MNEKRAVVWYGETRAGVLSKTGTGYDFVYDSDYVSRPGARPISLSLPLRAEKYESEALFPFFDGLLPEGWLFDLICAVAKIDRQDKFGLLLHTGGDPIGAVSVRPVED